MAAHENILYFGDLNYRIQLSNEEARSLAQQDACSKLVAADQLSTCMREKRVFVGFSEGPLVFRPTYKYDNGSDVYDSSEKQRIPSWTDRIVYRGTGLDLLRYNRAELMLSDHRPGESPLHSNAAHLPKSKSPSCSLWYFQGGRQCDRPWQERSDRERTSC